MAFKNPVNDWDKTFCGSFVLFMSCVFHAFASVYCCLVVTCGEGLTSWFSFVMFNCVFVTFPRCILGQVWYLFVSIPDLCRLSYFNHFKPNGISDSYQLNQSIFVVNDV